MAIWLKELDIKNEWNEVNDDETKIVELCKAIISKMENLYVFDDFEIEDEKEYIMQEFQELVDMGCEDFDDFNLVWERLYDWADQETTNNKKTGKVCWVKIF